MSDLFLRAFDKVKRLCRYSNSTLSPLPSLSDVVLVERETTYEEVSEFLSYLFPSFPLFDYEIVIVCDSIPPEVEGLLLRIGSDHRLSILYVDPRATIVERRLAGFYYCLPITPYIAFLSTRIKVDEEKSVNWLGGLVFSLGVESEETIGEVAPRGCEYGVQIYRRASFERRVFEKETGGATIASEVESTRAWFRERGILTKIVDSVISLEE
jgi:hypothetical protein